jgi:hypothetical protein
MNSIARTVRRPISPDAIDTEPLMGTARNDFQRALYARVKGKGQLLLRTLLDFAGGKAECWPSNATIGVVTGYTPRYTQMLMRDLEEAQVILCAVDRSLPSQRRIIILDHPIPSGS